MRKKILQRVLVYGGILSVLLFVGWCTMIRMPGKSFRGTPPPLTQREIALRAELERDVRILAEEIGPRHAARPGSLERAADRLEAALADAGYETARHAFPASGRTCENLEVEIRGGEEIVVVGAHYDSVPACPAANDNASGVAGVLALARRFKGAKPARTLRFVLFANEEPPHFQTESMGSVAYAKRCLARGEKVVAMVSLETIGYYTVEEGSQQYPPPLGMLYPSRGDFIGFVGNVGSGSLVRRTIGTFRETATIPSEGGALPGWLPGVGWSDHWSFFERGIPALMVTDTAPFRYPHYHQSTDTPDKLDYESMARVITGLEAVIADLAGLE